MTQQLIACLGIYLREMKTYVHVETFVGTWLFLWALSVVTSN